MAREEAKKAIAQHCGLTIQGSRVGKGHCNFADFIFTLNLLESEGRNGQKQAGFYYYSNERLQDENAVVKPWLQSKLKDFGFAPEECSVRTNKPSTNKEGHVADFYIDFPWDNPTDNDYARIQSLCKRLRDFQKQVWDVMTNAERNKEISQYNTEHLIEVRDYISRRRKEMPTGGEDDEPEEVPQDQGCVVELLKSNLNVILTGAPGTGKTYMSKEVAKAMVGAKVSENATDNEKKRAKSEEEERIKSVQFHPGYDYSDFVVGMKPVLIFEGKKVFRDTQGFYTKKDETKEKYDEKNIEKRLSVGSKTEVSFLWEDGIFKKFADKAKDKYEEAIKEGKEPPKFVFLIDEINRADLSRVFGELFSLLEEEYRYPNDKGTGITLPNGEYFVIPKNLYILGTMNDIDRSVESMDFALRRRFAWYEVTAESSMEIIDKKVSDTGKASKLRGKMRALNELIAPMQKKGEGGDAQKTGDKQKLDLRLGSEYQLGGAIFAKFEKYAGRDDPFGELWRNHIENILKEYLRGRSNRDDLLKDLKDVYDEKVKVADKSVGSATGGNGAEKPSNDGE